jgi:hypothetical protein
MSESRGLFKLSRWWPAAITDRIASWDAAATCTFAHAENVRRASNVETTRRYPPLRTSAFERKLHGTEADLSGEKQTSISSGSRSLERHKNQILTE